MVKASERSLTALFPETVELRVDSVHILAAEAYRRDSHGCPVARATLDVFGGVSNEVDVNVMFNPAIPDDVDISILEGSELLARYSLPGFAEKIADWDHGREMIPFTATVTRVAIPA